ncbi:Os12g0621900, partial [Oryza sativa Japonica Group]
FISTPRKPGRELQLSLSTSCSSSTAKKEELAFIVEPSSSPTLSRSIFLTSCLPLYPLTPSHFIHCSDGNAAVAPGALRTAAADIVVVPTAVDQAEPSHHANVFSLKSSSKPLNNPRQWRSKYGDRPPSSSPPVAVAIVDSASSDLGVF